MRSREREEKQLRSLLRELREQAGLRQADLASRLGKPQSYVSKFESGERRLDFLEVRDVCRAIGIKLQDVVKEFD